MAYSRNRWLLAFSICPLLLLLASPSLVMAQHALYAEHEGEMRLVRRVQEQRPIVEQDGHEMVALAQKFLLRKVDEFSPAFITVRKLSIGIHTMDVVGTSTMQFSNNFVLEGEFESAYALKNAFLVLETTYQKSPAALFVQEIGNLSPGKPRSLKIVLRANAGTEPFKYQLRLFAGGREVFHSEQSARFREEMLDQMVARRIVQAGDAEPQLFFGPPAAYPPQLAKSKPPGTATVRFRIDARGVVLDPVATAASHPAFGEAAVATLRQWRFVPRVRDGQPVEATVNLPVVFNPP